MTRALRYVWESLLRCILLVCILEGVKPFDSFSLVLAPVFEDLDLLGVVAEFLSFAGDHLILGWPALDSVELGKF